MNYSFSLKVYIVFLLLGINVNGQTTSCYSDSNIIDSVHLKHSFIKQNFPLLFTSQFTDACKCNLEQSISNTSNENGFCVINEGFLFSYVNKNCIQGSCWDFANRIFTNTGLNKIKKTVYTSKKNAKQFANKALLKPGDWIYHINYDFNNVEHSAIFICWKDYEKSIGITLSYAGMNRKTTGKFGIYDLSGVYAIYRL